jgi:hypothetical protein
MASARALVMRNKRARGCDVPAVADARNAELTEARYDDAKNRTLGSETDRSGAQRCDELSDHCKTGRSAIDA